MKKRTYFTKKDLISLGVYLLSDERTNLVMSHPELKDPARLKDVSHADIENWKFREANKTN